MKFSALAFASLLWLSAWSQSSLEQDFNLQLDTCTTSEAVSQWATQVSRTNFWEDPDISHLAIQLALQRINLSTDSNYYSKIIREHSVIHALRNEGDSNLYYSKLALLTYPKTDSANIGYQHRNIGIAYAQLEQHDSSISSLYDALRWLPDNDSLLRPLTYLELAKMLYKVNNYELSIIYANKSIEYFQSTGRLRDLGASWNTLALAMINQVPVDPSCIEAEHNSINIFKSFSDTAQILKGYINLGIGHLELDHLDSALYYLHLAESYEDYFSNDYFVEERATLWSNLAVAHYYNNEIYAAQEYAERAYPLTVIHDFKFVRQYLTSTLVKIYSDLGNLELALKYSLEETDLVKTNIRLTNENLLKYVEREFEEKNYRRILELKNKQAAFVNSELKHERLILTAGVGMLLTLLIILYKLYRLVQNKRIEAAANAQYLRELNESKNTLFSIMGHDLRGPVGNSLYLLKELPQVGDQLSADSTQILNGVAQSLTEVHGLLENLLLWSREQSNDLKIHKTSVQLKSMVSQCYQLMLVQLPIRGMDLEVEVDRNLSWNIDPHIYSTILRNIVSNALKYGPPETKVKCTIHIEDNRLITEICDEGKGIHEDLLKSILESNSIRANTKNGLGLRLVHRLVGQLEGTIEYNRTYKGFCIRVSIPA